MDTTATPESELKHWPNPYEADDKNPHRNDRWPISLNMRKALVAATLEQCGKAPDGSPLDPERARRINLTHRDTNSGMRILISLEKTTAAFRKVRELRDTEPDDCQKALDAYCQSLVTPEIEEEIDKILEEFPMPPEPPPAERIKKADRDRAKKLLEDRWPLSVDVRGRVIATAMQLAGFSVSGDDVVEPLFGSNDHSSNRDIQASLRILISFDRLSVEQIDLDAKIKARKLKLAPPPNSVWSPEAVKRIGQLINQESIRRNGVTIPLQPDDD